MMRACHEPQSLALQKVFDSDDILSRVLHFLSFQEMNDFMVGLPTKKTVCRNIEIGYDVWIGSEKLIVFFVSTKIRLTSFILAYDFITDYHLLALANLSPNLLRISGASSSDCCVSSTGIRWVAERCPRIESWALCPNDPEASYKVIADAYPLLRYILIGHSDDDGVVDRSAVLSIVNGCQQLESLEISLSDIVDADIERICTLSRLKSLEILSCSELSPNCLQFLLRCNHLETLILTYSVLYSVSTEVDVTIFKDTILELLTTSKSLCYVEIFSGYDVVLWDIDVPSTWRQVVTDDAFHEFFKL